MKDLYAVLGVARSATQDEIKRAYRRLSHSHHPDQGGDKDKFQKIAEAYAVLGDPDKRKAYDASLSKAVVEDIEAVATEVVREFFQTL